VRIAAGLVNAFNVMSALTYQSGFRGATLPIDCGYKEKSPELRCSGPVGHPTSTTNGNGNCELKSPLSLLFREGKNGKNGSGYYSK